MQDLLAFSKVISDPLSVRIIAALRNGELCRCELMDLFPNAQNAVSARMKHLRTMGLIRARQRSRWTGVRIAPKYADLVETVFEVFDSELAWDSGLIEDGEAIQRMLAQRVDGWCVPAHESRGNASHGP